MLVTTEAIVLRARKQGETSKIVTLYTLAYGKLNAIAKGAREMKSKFGGGLEMFARSNIVLYKRDKSDALNLLSKAETLNSHSGILRSLKKIEVATAIHELLLHAMHDEEANAELYQSLSHVLDAIASSEESAAPILTAQFYLAFARIMGFEIDFSELRYSPKLIEMLHAIESWSGGTIRLDARQEEQLRAFFMSYFAEHLPGVSRRSLRSAGVFSSL